jgi:hypothetical protein
LHAAHCASFQNDFGVFKIRPVGELLVDGQPSTDDAIQVFEQQLPHRLDLSFVQMREPPQNKSLVLSRGGKIDAVLDKRMRNQTSRVRTVDIIRDIESRFRKA